MARWTFALGGLITTATAYSQYGLTGLPADIYDPICATACLRSFYTMTDTLLNTTSLVPLHKWHAQYNVLYSTQAQGTLMNKYG